jgi:glycosyltransferase involved in cell wall biosynthesis
MVQRQRTALTLSDSSLVDPVRRATAAPTILVVTRFPLYPPLGGAPLRNWQNVRLLGRIADIHVLAMVSGGRGQPEGAPAKIASYSQAIVGRSPASNFIEAVAHRLWIVRPHGHPWTDAYYAGSDAPRVFNRVLDEVKPQLVVFEELWLHRYLKAALRSRASVILDLHNVEGVLRKKAVANGRLLSQCAHRLAERRVRVVERDFVRKATQVWVCSPDDVSLVNKVYGRCHEVHIIPNGVDMSYYNRTRVTRDILAPGLDPTRPSLLFPGTFAYGPNARGAAFFLRKIYPKLRHCGLKYQIVFAGKAPTAEMHRAAELDPDIILTGEVKDMRPYFFRAAVVIVPLLDGGGTRLKILEAFASGTPVVSTVKGAEGLMVNHEQELLLADNAQAFAEACVRVITDAVLGRRLASAGLKLVSEHYSWNALAPRVADTCESLLHYPPSPGS